eukprot:CAMPEP_0201724624 /NCGR_PEP_ID=MMETSP0593-20130828/8328_1 /ASSEMBLY_ACC=CAM_ASM_000672 /TAXON_ID=267983 /ORGANISM="Skeletonema japonicum, Strain CCMP2506" /LENGTH=330 /DNA_ID=CAMNT_0048215925 /DNA_START=314 /DNA_END=1306 /DNA_ORIENTATION=-
MPLFGGYKANKLKPQLKMAVTRFTIASNKKSALMKQQIREIAKLLAEDPPKEEKARIKAEALIRDDDVVEAYEILQLNCDLLAERINLISHSKECPADLLSTVSTIIWASAIVDIPELIEVRKQFKYKFGAAFDERAMRNVDGILNDRVVSKLSVQPPVAYRVQTYLEKISDEHEVGWKPSVPLQAKDISQPMVPPTGRDVPEAPGSGLGSSIPPPVMMASSPPLVLPAAPKIAEPDLPVIPPPVVPLVPEEDDDSNLEVDIYIPAAFQSQPHSGGNSNNNNNTEENNRGRTQSAGESSRSVNNDNDDEDKTGGDFSHEDLLQRFAMLNR